ncbi:MAG: LysM domain-containing protein [Xenococcaceae cyanobacterium MO_207.B15]|nr:LysM domain-containing protein [Xenococcaceae cyanobacterium MO_207.B15]
MSVQLTCPVCDRSQIETNTCPNCETDLSTYRMLAELPVETPIEKKEQTRTIPLWLPVSVAVLFLLLGIGLGVASNSLISRQKPPTTPTSKTASSPIPETKPDELVVSPNATEKSEEVESSQSSLFRRETTKTAMNSSKYCGGFNYVVRKGDSLSLIASRFYGDSNSLSLISIANPQLQGRENLIEIGETLLVPNREANCP